MTEQHRLEPTSAERRRLRSHFGFSKVPFSKQMRAAQMFDSSGQRELLTALQCWLEILGFVLITGPSGVGKSMTIRRFVNELDPHRYYAIDFTYLPSTLTGFLRSLNRQLGLPMKLHSADLFDQAHKFLVDYEAEHSRHPIIVLDDAEGLTVSVIDALRRLTAWRIDQADRFSILLSGTDELLRTLAHSQLAPLRTRIGYTQQLRAFTFEDTRNYLKYHLQRADIDQGLFTDEASKRIFQASHGRPRSINQLATQALIQATVLGRDVIDADFMKILISTHPFYEGTGASP